jgi:hypothetical protein
MAAMKVTQQQALVLLLGALRELVHENRAQADYLIPRNEDERRHKAWLEGRASAFDRSAELLGKILA